MTVQQTFHPARFAVIRMALGRPFGDRDVRCDCVISSGVVWSASHNQLVAA